MAVDLEYYGVPPADYIQLSNRTRLTAASGQTTFPAPYTVGYVDVYYNGAKLDPYTEFTATDGANVILTSAAGATGDIVEVISQAQVALTNTYTQQQVNALTSMYYGVCTGTGDAQVLVTTPTFTAYSDGMMVRCRAIATNTSTTPTIAINGLAAITIVSNNSQGALYGNDFTANNELTLRYVQAINKFVLVDGGVTQQTQAQFDNSNRIATTSFVKNTGLQASGLTTVTTTSTLTSSSFGGTVLLNSPSAITVTLPSAVNAAYGGRIEFINAAAGTVTVQKGGTDLLNTGMSNVTSIPIFSGESLVVENTVAGQWIAVGGSGRLPYTKGFVSTLGNPGYQRLPSGLIMQFGSATTNSSGNIGGSWPIAFPNTPISCSAISTGSNVYTVLALASATSFQFNGYISTTGAAVGAGVGMDWMAVGY